MRLKLRFRDFTYIKIMEISQKLVHEVAVVRQFYVHEIATVNEVAVMK